MKNESSSWHQQKYPKSFCLPNGENYTGKCKNMDSPYCFSFFLLEKEVKTLFHISNSHGVPNFKHRNLGFHGSRKTFIRENNLTKKFSNALTDTYYVYLLFFWKYNKNYSSELILYKILKTDNHKFYESLVWTEIYFSTAF